MKYNVINSSKKRNRKFPASLHILIFVKKIYNQKELLRTISESLELQLQLNPSRLACVRFHPLVRDAKPQKADRMGTELHLAQQLLGQRKHLIFGAQHMVYCDAARYLTEVPEFDLQRQRTPLEIILRNAPFQLQDRMIQFYRGSRRLADVLLKRLLAADGFSLPFRDDWTLVDTTGEIVEHLPHLSEFLRQMQQRQLAQVRTSKHAHAMQLLGCLLPHSPYLLHLQL